MVGKDVDEVYVMGKGVDEVCVVGKEVTIQLSIRTWIVKESE